MSAGARLGVRASRPFRPGLSRLSPALRRRIFGYSLVLPAAVFSLALVAYPLVRTLWMSLHNYNLSRPARLNDFVGLDHYVDLAQDSQFWHAVGAMIIYSASVTVVAYVVGLCSALLLQRRSAGMRIGRAILTIPWAVPGVVAAFTFVWMFDASFGVVNFLLQRVGLVQEPVGWLVQPRTAMAVVVLAAIWKTVPFNMLTHLAGLQAIPADLYEAVRVDGADRVQEFWHITWPALGHVRLVTILLTVLHAFREFGQIFVITGGGPSRSTETLSVQIYVEAFQYFHFGYASALGMLMLAISLVFTLFTVRTLRTEFH